MAASEAVAENLIVRHGVDGATVRVHHEFVDANRTPQGGARSSTRRRLGIPEEAFVLGSVGLPDWRKAPDLFLRAGWQLRRAHPDLDLHLVWVGGDAGTPDRWQLGYEAAALNLDDRTHWVAGVADPTPFLAAMDVFALTSREDAFPLAALEAAAAGLPIVCFDRGGTRELVRDDAGIVVAYPDLDAFADAVGALALDPDRRRDLGATAADRVRQEHDTAVAAPRLWADVQSWLAG